MKFKRVLFLGVILIIAFGSFWKFYQKDVSVTFDVVEREDAVQSNIVDKIVKKKYIEKKIKPEEKLVLEERADNYIVSCGEKIRKDYELSDDLLNDDSLDKHSLELLKNESSLSQLAYLFISGGYDDVQIRINLEKAYLLEPYNKLVNWVFLINCVNSPSNCDFELLNRILETDRNNSAIFLNLATLNLKKQNEQAAFNILQDFISAPEYKEYFGEYLFLFNQAFKESMTDKELAASVAYSFMNIIPLSSYSEIINYCTKNLDNKVDEVELCLNVANKMERKGNTLVSNLIGNVIKSKIYEHLNERELLSDSKKYREEYGKLTNSEHFIKAINLMSYDYKLLDFLLSNITKYGEKRTYELVIGEAIRLSKDKNYNPCTNKRYLPKYEEVIFD